MWLNKLPLDGFHITAKYNLAFRKPDSTTDGDGTSSPHTVLISRLFTGLGE